MEVETAEMAGHCVKRLAEAASDDGGPEGRPIQIDDCENTTLKVKLQEKDLMKRAKQLEKNRIKTLICHGKSRYCVKRCRTWVNRCKKVLQLKKQRDNKFFITKSQKRQNECNFRTGSMDEDSALPGGVSNVACGPLPRSTASTHDPNRTGRLEVMVRISPSREGRVRKEKGEETLSV